MITRTLPASPSRKKLPNSQRENENPQRAREKGFDRRKFNSDSESGRPQVIGLLSNISNMADKTRKRGG